jgi:hypothetical protein
VTLENEVGNELVFEIVALLAFGDNRKPGLGCGEGTRLFRNSVQEMMEALK